MEKETNCNCFVCGSPMYWSIIRKNARYKCNNCRDKQKEKNDKLRFETDILYKAKRLQRLNKAKKLIQNKASNPNDYKKAFSIIENKLYKPGWFQSVPEILVAAEFIRTNTKIIHQKYLAGHKIDFLLPKLKVVLEIDGYFHTEEKDKIFDSEVQETLGKEWCIIRLKADDFPEHLPHLLYNIEIMTKAIKERRKEEKPKQIIYKNIKYKNVVI